MHSNLVPLTQNKYSYILEWLIPILLFFKKNLAFLGCNKLASIARFSSKVTVRMRAVCIPTSKGANLATTQVSEGNL